MTRSKGIRKRQVWYWTEEEEELMRKHYPYIGAAAMCRMLPRRNYKNITEKARRMGLKITQECADRLQKREGQHYNPSSERIERMCREIREEKLAKMRDR